MRLDKCKLVVDLGRFKITYIFINLRVLNLKTDDEENVGRRTLSRQSDPCLGYISVIKYVFLRRTVLQSLNKVINEQTE